MLSDEAENAVAEVTETPAKKRKPRGMSLADWRKKQRERPKAKKPGRKPSKNSKIAVTIRYSPKVLEYFRGTGPGWQARMDSVLVSYVKHRSALDEED